jgi:hypothetical membrane protein
MNGVSISSFLTQTYPLFGFTGSLLMIFAMFTTGIFYRGKMGERYSVLNHYISELGEVGVSRLAWLFNAGLILGGLLLLPFMVGFSLELNNLWAKLGMIVGVWAAFSVMAVGVFPMNNRNAHIFVAMSYFRSGLVMVLLFSVAVFVQPLGQEVISKASNIAGLISLLCYATFLLTSDAPKKKNEEAESKNVLDPEAEKVRPRYWRITILEWMVFFSTILWFLIIAIYRFMA